MAQRPWRAAAASEPRLSGRVPLISLWIPEWSLQPNPCKNLYHLVWTRPARLHGQAVLIPGPRERPELVEIDTRPLGKPTSLTPLSYCLFRPEEQHGRSSIEDVIPPMCRWHRKMDDAFFRDGLPIPHFQQHRLTTVSVRCFNYSVCL